MRTTLATLSLFFVLGMTNPAQGQRTPGYYQTATYNSYNPSTGRFDLQQSIWYALPDPTLYGTGPYPVFMWTPATYEPFNDSMSLVFATEMALRGFVGAAVQYSNTESVEDCGVYQSRAQGVYDATRPLSAVNVICALPNSNCAAGITTAGNSEGAAIAIMAKNYAPQVQATYAMSISDYEANTGLSMAPCLYKSTTAIPANRLMIVDGANDQVFGLGVWLEATSGFYCANSTSCFSPDGSGAGWYIVQPSETVGGNPDHCYELSGGCGNTAYEPNWVVPAQYQWSLAPNLDWLASMGTYRAGISPLSLRGRK